MIISHKYKFIFIKTRKTSGTSIEAQLSNYLGEDDIITLQPRFSPVNNVPRNHKGVFNPIDRVKSLKEKNNPNILKTFLRQCKRFTKFGVHAPAWEVRKKVGEDVWNNYFKFCVERNPWDKIVSAYKEQSESFEEIIKRPYNYSLYTIEDEVVVDRILYFENLYEELRDVFEYLGIPFDGLNIHHRKSKRPSYREFFSGEYEKYIDVIRQEFEKEIELHGYEF